MNVQEEQLRQLKLANAYLNPGSALLKFFARVCGFLFLVFGLFGLMVQLTRLFALPAPAVSHPAHQFPKGGSVQPSSYPRLVKQKEVR